MYRASSIRLSIIGAGPVGLTLALLAAERLPWVQVTLWDSRPDDSDISNDPRTLALSLGSVQLLQRLKAWPGTHCQAIDAVHISQHSQRNGLCGDAFVHLTAKALAVPMLGAVTHYGRLCQTLRHRWRQMSEQAPNRLRSCFGFPVTRLKNLPHCVEVQAGVTQEADLAVVAEGSVGATQASLWDNDVRASAQWKWQYAQRAWVGRVTLTTPHGGVAFERFTEGGPVAILPLPEHEGQHTAALVWCVASDHDPLLSLDNSQRLGLLHSFLHPRVGQVKELSDLKSYPLGLQAYCTLTQGRAVRIGNAAQTLHPVAGQGLNLGLRDAYALVEALRANDVLSALRRLEWRRAPDRWALLATTDFLARSFAWQLPGADSLRGLSLAALNKVGPLKAILARNMMFGIR